MNPTAQYQKTNNALQERKTDFIVKTNLELKHSGFLPYHYVLEFIIIIWKQPKTNKVFFSMKMLCNKQAVSCIKPTIGKKEEIFLAKQLLIRELWNCFFIQENDCFICEDNIKFGSKQEMYANKLEK